MSLIDWWKRQTGQPEVPKRFADVWKPITGVPDYVCTKEELTNANTALHVYLTFLKSVEEKLPNTGEAQVALRNLQAAVEHMAQDTKTEQVTKRLRQRFTMILDCIKILQDEIANAKSDLKVV